MGDWTVPGGTSQSPAPVSLQPASGSGLSQVFTLTYTDTNGANDLGVINVLINGALNGVHACYLAFSQPSDALYLVNDAGSACRRR